MRKRVFSIFLIISTFFSFAHADSPAKDSPPPTTTFTDRVHKIYEMNGKTMVSFHRQAAIYESADKKDQEVLRKSKAQNTSVVVEVEPFAQKVRKVSPLK